MIRKRLHPLILPSYVEDEAGVDGQFVRETEKFHAHKGTL
jgi:hypothetical protein